MTRHKDHGVEKYLEGCDCKICSSAFTAREKARREDFATTVGIDSSNMARGIHNRSTYQKGCRCEDCKAASSEYMRSRRLLKNREPIKTVHVARAGTKGIPDDD